MRVSRLRLVTTLLALAGATGCATKVKVTRTKPAEINLGGVRNVAVMDLAGSDGHAMANELTQRIFDSKRFTVLERSALEKIIKEHRLTNSSGLFTEGTPLGEMLPASAIVIGAAQGTARGELTSRDTVCSRWDNKKEIKYRCTEYTRTASVNYEANLKLVDSKTGSILAPKSLRCSKGDKKITTEQQPDAIDTPGMIAACRAQVISTFMPLIVPTDVQEEVVLVEDSALPSLEIGNRMAKLGDWAAAHDEYVKAAAKADADAGLSPKVKSKAYYAVGLSLVFNARFDEGIASLKRAVSLTGDEDAGQLMRRAQQWKVDAEKLAKQNADAQGKI